MTRAPALGVAASGTTNVSPKRWLKRSAMSRVISTCWRWSSPTGTALASYSRMSAACSAGYVNSPPEMNSRFADLSLNCVMRVSSP